MPSFGAITLLGILVDERDCAPMTLRVRPAHHDHERVGIGATDAPSELGPASCRECSCGGIRRGPRPRMTCFTPWYLSRARSEAEMRGVS